MASAPQRPQAKLLDAIQAPPDREQLEQIARGIATEPGELPDEAGLAAVLDSAAGLTRYEAEGAFSLSLLSHQRHDSADDAARGFLAGVLDQQAMLGAGIDARGAAIHCEYRKIIDREIHAWKIFRKHANRAIPVVCHRYWQSGL